MSGRPSSGVNAYLAWRLNVKVPVGPFNQEKALLSDCDIFVNLLITFVSSSTGHTKLNVQHQYQPSVKMIFIHDEHHMETGLNLNN